MVPLSRSSSSGISPKSGPAEGVVMRRPTSSLYKLERSQQNVTLGSVVVDDTQTAVPAVVVSNEFFPDLGNICGLPARAARSCRFEIMAGRISQPHYCLRKIPVLLNFYILAFGCSWSWRLPHRPCPFGVSHGLVSRRGARHCIDSAHDLLGTRRCTFDIRRAMRRARPAEWTSFGNMEKKRKERA